MRSSESPTATQRTTGFSTAWWLFAGWLAFVALVIAGANGGRRHLVYAVADAVPFGDKLGHVVLIGTLAGLSNLATNGRRVELGPFRWLLGGLIIAGLMTLEEISQLWIPTRSFDFGDLSANCLGVILAEIAWRSTRRPASPGPKIDGGTTA